MVGGYDDDSHTQSRYSHRDTAEPCLPDWEFEDLQLDVRLVTPCGSRARLYLHVEVDEDTRLLRRCRLHFG